MNICIFCEYSACDWDILKKHLMQHMQIPYLCKVCDGNVGNQRKIECSEHTNTDNIVFDCDDLDFSMFWVWNFIEYSKFDVIKYSKKPIHGCVVCKNVSKLGMKLIDDSSYFDVKCDPGTVRDHIKSHLRYYKYYCSECKHIASRKNILKHIQKCHVGVDADRLVREAKPLTKLEQLINASKAKFLELREKHLQSCLVKVNGNVSEVSHNLAAEEANSLELLENNRPSDFTDNDNKSISSYSLSNHIDDVILKECSVILSRLSNEEIDAYKAKICHINEGGATNNEHELIEETDVQDKVEEMEIPEFVDDDQTATEGNQRFFCIFCRDKDLKSYEEAFKHYQVHLDYYPLKCALCDEVSLSLKNIFKHFRAEHENEEKAVFQRCENETMSTWIKSFLTLQTKNLTSFPIKSPCPVCELIHKEIVDLPLYQSTPKKLVVHLLNHLCYEPYVCIDCWSHNDLVTFTQLDNRKAYNHIFKKHKEKINIDLSAILKKDRKIITLEKFIYQYLLVKGIKYNERTHAKIPNFIISAFEKKSKEKEERIYSQNSLIMADSHVASKSNTEMVAIERQAIKTPLSSNENNTCEIEKTVSSPSLVVNISPLVAAVNDENPYICRFFCVFCENKTFFSSKLDACSHIAEHLSYYPVVCLFCSSKFADLKSLMSHHTETHANTSSPWVDNPSSSLLYVVNEDEELEKWIEEFLDFQTSSRSWSLFTASFRHNCPVCKRMISDFPSSFTNFKTDTSFQQHVHHHLRYYPYECILCKDENKSTRIPLIDSCASQHLLNHGIHFVDSVSNFFLKTTTIKAVELLISEAVAKNSLSQACSDKVLNIIDSSSRISSNPLNKKENECSEKFNASLTGILSVINNKAASQISEEDTVRCYHCQVVLNGWSLLKEHHFRIHPGLSLIGY